MEARPVTSRHFAAIAIVSFATLAAQILFSRIFSVTMIYHMAFAGITLAMLGLTGGALKVYTMPDTYSAARADQVLAKSMSSCAVFLALAAILHVSLAGLVASWFPKSVTTILLLSILGSLILLLTAFFQSGIAIALLLTRFPASTNRLYAFDLGGAALGCIVIIAALKWFDPMGALLLITLLLAAFAWQLAASMKIKIATVALALLCAVQLVTYAGGAPLFHLLWAKYVLDLSPPEFERWNTYSRVVVAQNQTTVPFGEGYRHNESMLIPQRRLTIDADAATVLTAFNGDTTKLGYLKDDIVNLAYDVRPPESVAIIGVGGGRDILSALTFGTKHIQGIELNPAIYEALTDKFGDFAGHLEHRPGVKLDIAEARSFITSNRDRYDLIQISLIDTWATTAAGGLTLSENKLYTTDAWKDFLDRLNDKGMVSVSRWYDPVIHTGEFYRLLAIAADALKSRDPGVNPRQHILAASVNRMITVITSASPFTAQEIARFKSSCHRLGFTPLLTPDFATDDKAAKIASGTADAAFFNSMPIDVSASTDDKPFFFHMLRLGQLLKGNLSQNTAPAKKSVTVESGFSENNNQAIITLAGLLIFTLTTACILIVPPMASIYKTHHVRLRETAPYIIYFLGIGFGFMLIEISQMQRLMIFLGHPVYGLSIVLFTLLLASGAGSYLQQRVSPGSRLWFGPALVCAALVATGLFTPLVTEHLKYYDTLIRIAGSIAMIAPMGVCMGMMFPIGVTLAKAHQEELLPWYWGVNGAASVFASVFAVVLSLQCGISTTFWTGVLCYVPCLLITLCLSAKMHNANASERMAA